MKNQAMSDWQKAVLPSSATISDAIQVLNNVSLRFVLVLDQKRKILGTVTDGDVRRGLIQQLGMETPIAEIMNKAPVTVNASVGQAEMIRLMREEDILQLPVVENDGTIARVEFLQQLSGAPELENIVVLMAGGFGKRLHPLTSTTPKPMLKVGSKPILETIVEQLVEAGFRKIFISLFYKADIVKDYFGNGAKWGIEIDYLVEESPLGTAGALSLVPGSARGLPLLVMNGDILTKVDFSQLLSFHAAQGCDLTVCAREYDVQVPYGVLDVSRNRVIGLTEKPTHSVFVNAGIYVLNPGLLPQFCRGQARDMTDLISEQLESQQPINVFPIYEYWIDIGRIEEYKRANSDLDNFADDR